MPLPYSISLKNATVEFDKGFVCSNIDWNVHPEHHWLICGNNGSGKSALAAILTGAGDIQDGIVKNLPDRVSLVSFEAQQELIEAERRKDDADIMDVIAEGTPVAAGSWPADVPKALNARRAIRRASVDVSLVPVLACQYLMNASYRSSGLAGLTRLGAARPRLCTSMSLRI